MAQAGIQLVSIGLFGETERLEPFIAFVHHKEFQRAQLMNLHSEKKGNQEDQENFGLLQKV